jgi:hypothetical protein
MEHNRPNQVKKNKQATKGYGETNIGHVYSMYIKGWRERGEIAQKGKRAKHCEVGENTSR